jgi:hypothetical protein
MGELRLARRGPRFVYLRDTSDTSDMAVGDAAGDAESSDRVVWQVVAANNRLLGRSSRSYVALLKTRAADLTRSIELDDQRGTWGWTYSFGGAPLARSARDFGTRLACVSAAEQFLSSAVLAEADSSYLHQPRRRPAPRRGLSVSAP